ncbi:hypothetical protein FHT32_000352 [Variovorax sp. SG517]|nr:hypothetical protein [Variovorax sp. SG517]
MEQRGNSGATVRSRPYGRVQALGLQLTAMSMATADSGGIQRPGQRIG